MKLTHEGSINTENSLQILDIILAFSQKNFCLTSTQESVFVQCWEGNSYQKIANSLGYDCDYVKKVGSQLWKYLSKVLGKKVTKSNFQSLLRQYVIEHQLDTVNLTKSEKAVAFNNSNITENKTRVDWGEASDVSVFYGRQSELNKLESWIIKDKCRLVAILAMGGMGKTAVSIKLAQQLQSNFDYVIWRTVRDSPLLSEFLADITKFIDNEESTKLADSTIGCLSQLIKYLKKYRCLIVIDNFETVLQPNSSLHLYRDGYEDYGELLRRVGDVLHQSCVVVTSREKPEEIAALQGDKLPVRVWSLQGLDEIAGRELLQAKGLQINIERTATGFTQEPVIIEYVTEKFIDSVTKEIITEKIVLFNTYALIKPQGKDYLKDSQVRVILEPIVNKLLVHFASQKEFEEQLKSILSRLESSKLKTGYAAGNIINILHHLKTDLTEFDFSNLPIWQADLRNITLHNCNFAGADFCSSAFAQVFSAITCVKFSSQGDYLATADTNGEVKIWDINTGECLKTLRSPKLYEKMNITGIKGLTEAQTMTLKALGAVKG